MCVSTGPGARGRRPSSRTPRAPSPRSPPARARAARGSSRRPRRRPAPPRRGRARPSGPTPRGPLRGAPQASATAAPGPHADRDAQAADGDPGSSGSTLRAPRGRAGGSAVPAWPGPRWHYPARRRRCGAPAAWRAPRRRRPPAPAAPGPTRSGPAGPLRRPGRSHRCRSRHRPGSRGQRPRGRRSPGSRPRSAGAQPGAPPVGWPGGGCAGSAFGAEPRQSHRAGCGRSCPRRVRLCLVLLASWTPSTACHTVHCWLPGRRAVHRILGPLLPELQGLCAHLSSRSPCLASHTMSCQPAELKTAGYMQPLCPRLPRPTPAQQPTDWSCLACHKRNCQHAALPAPHPTLVPLPEARIPILALLKSRCS
mmetsp:Transcript_10771/g.30377  ORF Transcript_10771/g.30377 Transcript_10771/m.30377 type:complete len:367 (-) Transcript_10771:103-1203(-)